MTDFEREDMELEAIMGGKFADLTPKTEENKAEKPVAKADSKKHIAPMKNVHAEEKPAENCCEPVSHAHRFMDKLKHTTKDVFLYSVLSLILFWWQQSGRLEETTAWYALLVCVGMVFFSVGKNWRGWCE